MTSLHSENDIGKYKATVAADFINARIRTAKVTAHPTRIEEFGPDFYRRMENCLSSYRQSVL